MKVLLYSLVLLSLVGLSVMVENNLWTEKDRTFLLQNLERTKAEMKKETEGLSVAQWHFKESDKSWSIAQVVEHMGLNERTFLHEASVILQSKPEPELLKTTRTDSTYLEWMGEPQPHVASKNDTPLGLMKGKDNLTYFVYGRDLIIQFIADTKADLKAYYTYRGGEEKRRSLHGLFVVHFGHTDRHLRQVRRIKQHKNYPKPTANALQTAK